MGTRKPQPPFPLGTWTHLIHPSLDRPYSPLQAAFGSNQPFCHSTLSGHTGRETDRHTGRWDRRHKLLCTKSAYAHALWIVSDALVNHHSEKNTHAKLEFDCLVITRCILAWVSRRRWLSFVQPSESRFNDSIATCTWPTVKQSIETQRKLRETKYFNWQLNVLLIAAYNELT